jgi:hypothetical protein
MTSWLIYLLGVVAFGLAYGFLKQHLSGWLFVSMALVYIAALGWMARRFSRR